MTFLCLLPHAVRSCMSHKHYLKCLPLTVNANTCAVATATHLLYKISPCLVHIRMNSWFWKKIMPSLCYVWIGKELCHRFDCKVLAGYLCANRPGLARRQYVCHGVASLCIPLYYVFSGLRQTSLRSATHKSTITRFRVLQLVFSSELESLWPRVRTKS